MYVIIGAGPSGLSLAYLLKKNGYDVTLIEKENEIGGCHKVKRVGGYFTEHGPRIYLNNYLTTISLLNDMKIDFNQLFTPYKFQLSNIGGQSLSHFTLKEMFLLTINYLLFSINKKHTRQITMAEFMDKNNFTNDAKDYVDRLCRLTDGAGSDRYTLYEFYELMNQNMLYTVYQPKIANDKGLFKLWRNKLEEIGVNILLNTKVDKLVLNDKETTIKSVITNKGEIKGDKFILALPPDNIIKILENSGDNRIRNSFGNFNDFQIWTEQTEYITYVPITFHWKKKIDLPKIYGFPKTSWGLAFIVLSDYMDMSNEPSKTLISSAITITNKKSEKTGKTADESNYGELLDEALRQLMISFPDLPKPDKIILSPGVKRIGNKWYSTDEAFVLTKNGYMDNRSKLINNLYNVGTQNGKSNYAFTSMESAVQNAVNLLQTEFGINYGIRNGWTVNQLLVFICVLLFYLIYLLKTYM